MVDTQSYSKREKLLESIKSKVGLGDRAGQPESQGGGRLSLTHQEGTHQRQGEGTSFPA